MYVTLSLFLYMSFDSEFADSMEEAFEVFHSESYEVTLTNDDEVKVSIVDIIGKSTESTKGGINEILNVKIHLPHESFACHDLKKGSVLILKSQSLVNLKIRIINILDYGEGDVTLECEGKHQR